MDRALRHPLAKPLVFILCLVPLAVLAGRGLDGGLGANPIEYLNRYLGDWALRFLLIGLAVTPLREISGWGALARFRRMLGLFAFAYVLLHLGSYVGLDQFFDWGVIGREIVKRPYMTLGMAAVLGLLPLAVTSTDAMQRRLGGKRWRALHRLVYAIAILGVTHHWMMVKKDISGPAIHAAILALLLGWRVVARLRHNRRQIKSEASACAPPPSSSPSLSA